MQRALGQATVEHFKGMTEALVAVRRYLKINPDHEAWIGSSVSSHRIILPSGIGFDRWFDQFGLDGSLGNITVGITYTEVITQLGWPDLCSTQLKRSPLAIIFLYGPKHVEFHFDDGGRLWLVQLDGLDAPKTILMA